MRVLSMGERCISGNDKQTVRLPLRAVTPGSGVAVSLSLRGRDLPSPV